MANLASPNDPMSSASSVGSPSNRRRAFLGVSSLLAALAAGAGLSQVLAPVIFQPQPPAPAPGMADLEAKVTALAEQVAAHEAAIQGSQIPYMLIGGTSRRGPSGSVADIYPLDIIKMNTAPQFLSADSSGVVSILASGYYRINFFAMQQGSHKWCRLLVNGTPQAYSDFSHTGMWVTASIDVTDYFTAGDKLCIECTAGDMAWESSTSGYSGLAISRIGIGLGPTKTDAHAP